MDFKYSIRFAQRNQTLPEEDEESCSIGGAPRESLVVLFPLCGDQLLVICEVVVPRSREMAWLLDKSPSSRRYVELADRADHHVAHTVIDERIFARLRHDRVQDYTLPR